MHDLCANDDKFLDKQMQNVLRCKYDKQRPDIFFAAPEIILSKLNICPFPHIQFPLIRFITFYSNKIVSKKFKLQKFIHQSDQC